ncbi:MAG: hypothetical protein U0W24_12890 [Bacteroidales bacterium]
MQNPKLFETIADIAYVAGCNKYYSGDSRSDIAKYIHWAREFEKIHRKTDWVQVDYMLEIEKFAENKLNQSH